MKAKLYLLDEDMELVLENDTVFTPESDTETIEEFKDRITETVSNEYVEDLEIETVELSDIKGNTIGVLKAKYKAADGLFKEMLKKTIDNKTKNKSATKKSAAAAAKTKASPATKAKVEKKPKESKLSPERQKAIEAARSEKRYKAGMKNIGRAITFTPSKKNAKPVTGIVKNLSLSKDLSRVYYSILADKTKKRVCCAVLNETIEFNS